MNIKEASEVLEMAYESRDEIVPLLLGKPGIGKTQAVRAFAERKGCKVVEIILSQCLPTEISGITMPDRDTHTMEVFDHVRLGELKDGDILFLDELTEAPPMVLSACLTLIQERRMMSGRRLPDVMIVAAANPIGSPAAIKESVRQRFMWLEIEFDKDEWVEFMRDVHGIEYIPEHLIDSMFTGAGSYNQLTPRTACKLILMCRKASSMGMREEAVSMIDNMFNSSITNSIWRAAKTRVINDDMIRDEIVRMIKDHVDMPYDDLVSTIKKLKIEELDDWIMDNLDAEMISEMENVIVTES